MESVSTTHDGNTVTLMSNFSYRPFGIAGGMDTGSGGTVSNIFDEAGRLTVANPGSPKERTYTYDDIGNLTGVSAPNTPWYSRTFGYDALNRLEHAEGPFGTIDFTYDGVGNRLTKTANSDIETYTYAAGTNRIQEITGPVAYNYDANGNIIGLGNKVLTYNQNNRLIRVEEDSDILGEYTYNGLGQRVIKEVDGVTTVFHYDFNGNIIAESDLDGNFNTEYLYNGKGRVALVDVASGEMFFFLNDRLGTPQMLTDASNTVVWEGLYKPFGEADVNPNSSVVNNFRFPGQYYDQETGLHYNYHRYYDPSTGRYLRPDPIGLTGGINLYVYANNNPINQFDAVGLNPAILAATGVGSELMMGGGVIHTQSQGAQRANEKLARALERGIRNTTGINGLTNSLIWFANLIDGPDDPADIEEWLKWKGLDSDDLCEEKAEPWQPITGGYNPEDPPPPPPNEPRWKKIVRVIMKLMRL